MLDIIICTLKIFIMLACLAVGCGMIILSIGDFKLGNMQRGVLMFVMGLFLVSFFISLLFN